MPPPLTPKEKPSSTSSSSSFGTLPGSSAVGDHGTRAGFPYGLPRGWSDLLSLRRCKRNLMAEQRGGVSTGVSGERVAQIQTHLHDLDRRQWSLWSATVAVMILLTIGVASFAFPGILAQEENTYS